MYKLTKNGGILRIDDGVCIPFDPTNMDYLNYLQWVEEGNSPYPADPLDHNSLIQSQIDAIEFVTLMNRGDREGWISMIEDKATAQGITQSQLLDPVTGNAFFRKLVDTDNQIRALRSQLI